MMKILIVEDEPAVGDFLRRFFAPLATSVVVVETLAEAMAEVEREPRPDVITLDLNLKDSRRLETLAKVREIREKHPKCVLLVLTGVGLPEDKARALEDGADAFVMKGELFPGEGKGFLDNLRDVVQSLTRTPVRYQMNGLILECLAGRIKDSLQARGEGD